MFSHFMTLFFEPVRLSNYGLWLGAVLHRKLNTSRNTLLGKFLLKFNFFISLHKNTLFSKVVKRGKQDLRYCDISHDAAPVM